MCVLFLFSLKTRGGVNVILLVSLGQYNSTKEHKFSPFFSSFTLPFLSSFSPFPLSLLSISHSFPPLHCLHSSHVLFAFFSSLLLFSFFFFSLSPFFSFFPLYPHFSISLFGLFFFSIKNHLFF